MATEPRTWSLSVLKAARADASGRVDVDSNNPIVFSIPAFQRSLVWPVDKQRGLIASILRGFPFGALLVVEHPEKREVTSKDGSTILAANFSIIDGLQRTMAISEHLRQPLAFAGEEAVSGPSFDALLFELQRETGVPIDRDKLMSALVGWMHATKTPDISEGFDFDSLLDDVAQRLGLVLDAPNIRALKGTAGKFLKAVRESVDISNHQIPVLVYNGPSDFLPEIFEQINTAGTVLSKYEIYAATWVSTVVEVKKKEIREAIARRYKVLEDEGFAIEESGSELHASLFDYLHGLSQYLGERYPLLFSSKDAQKGKLSGAFPLATLMLGASLDKMSTLNWLFPMSDGKLDVASFEAALFEAADFVNDVLSPFLAFKFTGDTGVLAHGELQMVSMVAAVSAHLHDHEADFQARGSVAARQRASALLAIGLPQHYVHDIIRQQWRGSLYTYAAERVWDGSQPSAIYTTPVDGDAFNIAMATAISDQLADSSGKRKSISAADRVILRFLYSPVVSVGDQAAHSFDIEHLIPVKRVTDMVGDEEGWPIGALGNLAVLPRGVNRIKQDETVTEYLARTVNPPTAAQATLTRKMILVPIESVAIPQEDGKDAMTREQYVAFVHSNWQAMRDQLRTNIGI